MTWNELVKVVICGTRIVAKDAMMMLSEDDDEPDWPYVCVEPGPYVAEIELSGDWHCSRFRIRKRGSNPSLGDALPTLTIDHAKAAFIDYDVFHAAVCKDFDAYETWTGMELDDELGLNFSGQIEFGGTPLVYVTSGDGDGSYPTFELVEDGIVVGLECHFDSLS